MIHHHGYLIFQISLIFFWIRIYFGWKNFSLVFHSSPWFRGFAICIYFKDFIKSTYFSTIPIRTECFRIAEGRCLQIPSPNLTTSGGRGFISRGLPNKFIQPAHVALGFCILESSIPDWNTAFLQDTENKREEIFAFFHLLGIACLLRRQHKKGNAHFGIYTFRAIFMDQNGVRRLSFSSLATASIYSSTRRVRWIKSAAPAWRRALRVSTNSL